MDEVQFEKGSITAIKHAFFTRYGGVSDAPYDSLNVGKHVEDDVHNVDQNRRRALAAVHVDPENFVFLGKLDHSNKIYQVDAKAGGVELNEHDVLMTNTPGLALGLSVADCLAVVLVDEEAPALALSHVGWRGLKVETLARSVDALVEEFGAKRNRIKAVISPSISPENYEVGAEVASQFDPKYSLERSEKLFLDLWTIAEDQLASAGVTQIENLKIDTYSDERFFSHRASGGNCGRGLALASL